MYTKDTTLKDVTLKTYRETLLLKRHEETLYAGPFIFLASAVRKSTYFTENTSNLGKIVLLDFVRSHSKALKTGTFCFC